jgi:hypothetical protein
MALMYVPSPPSAQVAENPVPAVLIKKSITPNLVERHNLAVICEPE